MGHIASTLSDHRELYHHHILELQSEMRTTSNIIIPVYYIKRWLLQFKRTELSSTALYDGAIDKFELSPFAGFMASSGSASSGPRKQAKSYPVTYDTSRNYYFYIMLLFY